jgi:hypothetical protein
MVRRSIPGRMRREIRTRAANLGGAALFIPGTRVEAERFA